MSDKELLDDKIVIYDDEGTEVLAKIVFTHVIDGLKYVVVEDQEKSDELYLYRYSEKEDGQGELFDVTDEKILSQINDLLDDYYLDDDLDD